ncbi:MAG TPA: insulinase family protein [Puia sp.]|nr:insulinase family protein [Puia sp.]
MVKKNFARLLCLVLSAGVSAGAGAQTSGSNEIPMDSGLRTGKLANGFTYYIQRNTVQEHKVTIHLVNKAGSILETEKQRGLAHFLEHMAFNGTTHFPKNELVGYLQKSGVRFGADLNAFTSFNTTVYQLPIMLKSKEQLRDALQVARDWAQGITLSDEEIDKERNVILEEKRLHAGLQERMQERTIPITYNHSLYADRLPIGLEDVILHADHSELRTFYRDWYRPDLQAVIVVGDIDVDQTEKLVRILFGDLRMPLNPRERKEFRVPLEGKNQYAAIADAEIKLPGMEVLIKLPGLIVKTASEYAEDMERQILNMLMNDRFNQAMQQADPPYLVGGMRVGGFEGGVDVLEGGVTTKAGRLQEGVRAWWSEMLRMKIQGFTPGEVQRAKEIMAAGLEQMGKERDKTDALVYIDKYTKHFLTGEAAPDLSYDLKLSRSALDTITAGGVSALLRKYFKDTDRDIIVKSDGMDGNVLPSEEVVAGWVRDEAGKPMAPYQDKTVSHGALMQERLKGGRIVEEKALPAVGATELRLDNGVKVVLKSTRYKNDQVLFNGYSIGGLNQVSDNDFYSGSLAASVVAASGVGDWTRIELSRFTARKNIQVVPYINDIYQGMTGGGTPENLEDLFQLIYLYFVSPRRDLVAFDNLIQQQKAAIEAGAAISQQRFRDTIYSVMGDYQFRKMPVPAEKLGSVSMEKALGVYRDRFSDASGFTFTFVGAFDMEKMKELAARYLGSLPGLGRKEEIIDLHLGYPTGHISKKVMAGTDARASVYLAFPGKFEYDVHDVRQMDAAAKILNYHLLARVREDQGGVYSINASVLPAKYPSGQYNFSVSFVCDPENVEVLILSVNSEIARLKTEGPTDDDLAKFKAEYRSFFAQALNDNPVWLNYITDQLQLNGEVTPIDIDGRLKAITKEGIQLVFRKYFNNGNYVRIVQLPTGK